MPLPNFIMHSCLFEFLLVVLTFQSEPLLLEILRAGGLKPESLNRLPKQKVVNDRG